MWPEFTQAAHRGTFGEPDTHVTDRGINFLHWLMDRYAVHCGQKHMCLFQRVTVKPVQLRDVLQTLGHECMQKLEGQWQYQYLHVTAKSQLPCSNHCLVPCQGTSISKLRSFAAQTWQDLAAACCVHDGKFAVQGQIRAASLLGADAGICKQMLCILPACIPVHSQITVVMTGCQPMLGTY